MLIQFFEEDNCSPKQDQSQKIQSLEDIIIKLEINLKDKQKSIDQMKETISHLEDSLGKTL